MSERDGEEKNARRRLRARRSGKFQDKPQALESSDDDINAPPPSLSSRRDSLSAANANTNSRRSERPQEDEAGLSDDDAESRTGDDEATAPPSSALAGKGMPPAYDDSTSEFNQLKNFLCQGVEDKDSAISETVTKYVIDAAYRKAVEPHVAVLNQYKASSDEVHGEILYPFIHDIITKTGLRSGSVFVDFGSGYGNVVIQVALETGCEAKGIEYRSAVADMAKEFRDEAEKRAAEFGLPHDFCLLEGSFLDSNDVDEWIQVADTIFCNNRAWQPATNFKLNEKLQRLKDWR